MYKQTQEIGLEQIIYVFKMIGESSCHCLRVLHGIPFDFWALCLGKMEMHHGPNSSGRRFLVEGTLQI